MRQKENGEGLCSVPSYYFDIIHKEQQSVGLTRSPAYWNRPREFSTDVYSRDLSSKVSTA